VKPLISVMTGVYNGAAYLGEAIESVLAQDYRPLELIVVDDGSDDGSGDVARRYPEVRCVSQERRGAGAARNRAVEHASGDFFAFLDADDRFTPGKLSRQMEALSADPALDVVFGHVREFVSPELSEEQRRLVRPPAPEPQPWTAPNLMLIRRASFERVGPFSETLRIADIVEWYSRAQEMLQSVVLQDVVLERRLHTQNSGLREQASRPEYLEVVRAALERRRSAAQEP
jgi:glycosyltransferase involved in cell wall biosynthesis